MDLAVIEKRCTELEGVRAFLDRHPDLKPAVLAAFDEELASARRAIEVLG